MRNKIITQEEIEKLVREIDYTNINLEIAWQIELIIKLREKFGDDYQIIPEKSLSKKDIKKEIDIAVYADNQPQVAIELKMPQNGAYPRRMSQAIIDIAFLEQLVSEHNYKQGYFIFLTNNKPFWDGDEIAGQAFYGCFRKGSELHGKIKLPDFMKTVEQQITGHYFIKWQDIPHSNFRYFILQIK